MSDRAAAPFPKWLLGAIILTGAVLVASIAMLLVLSRRGAEGGAVVVGKGGAAGGGGKSALAVDPGLEGLRVPEFALVDQDGKPVTQAVFDGRVTIVDFIFTHCQLVCPTMTGAMAGLQADLGGTPVRFVSISVDPEHDSPEVLKQYGGQFGADFSKWVFLTGDEKTVDNAVMETLQFRLQDDEFSGNEITLADGKKMKNILHPPHFVLVGPDRRVLGLYHSKQPELVEMLKERARVAADEMARRGGGK